MKIGIAADHGGFEVKEKLKEFLKQNYEVVDFGTNSEESVDYPKYAFLVGEAIARKKITFGIVICKTGIGMSIACNKVKGVRCAKVTTKEEAYLTRFHNDSNVIAIGSNQSLETIEELVQEFLTTKFSEEERHIRRNNLVDHYGE